MKYCKKCNLLIKDSDNCIKCGKALQEPSAKSPVVAATATGFEKERICTVLAENDIPYSVKLVTQKGVPAETNAVVGNNKTAHNIVVPYEFYNKAMEQLVGINAVKLNDDELQQLTASLENDEINGENANEDDYFSVKNRAIRIVSALAFFVLVALVVFGVDAFMQIIKAFFT